MGSRYIQSLSIESQYLIASKMCSIAETQVKYSRFLINLFKCLSRVYMYKGRNMNRQDFVTLPSKRLELFLRDGFVSLRHSYRRF